MKAKYSFIDEDNNFVLVYEYRGFEYNIYENSYLPISMQHTIERNKIDSFLFDLNNWYNESSKELYKNNIEKMEI